MYSGDTAPCQTIVSLARGAGTFLCESALGASATDKEPRGHCNAGEAGAMSARAGARRLVLTHYGAQANPRDLARAASATYGADIAVADDGSVFEV